MEENSIKNEVSSEDTLESANKKRRTRRSPELNLKEVSILDFLLKNRFTRASTGATVEEIAFGVSRDHKEALTSSGATEDKNPYLGKRQAYMLINKLVEKNFIDLALKQERKNSFYILPEGVKAYAKHMDTTQEHFINFAQAMQFLQGNWGGEMDKILEQMFPE